MGREDVAQYGAGGEHEYEERSRDGNARWLPGSVSDKLLGCAASRGSACEWAG
jgi:hypothetical protein